MAKAFSSEDGTGSREENASNRKGTHSDFVPVLIACCLAMLAVGDNSTAIMAGLPEMTATLRLGPGEVEWVVNAYLLTAAVFIVVGGGAADQFGARRSSIAGIVLFALASLVIALAPSGLVVIGGRALQGLGAAFAVSGTLAAVSEAAPDARRAEAIGTWTGFLMLGFSLGSLIGGAVTHYAGWRFIFWLNVIAMVPAALMLLRHPANRGQRKSSMDWAGLLGLAVFMVSLISGLQALAHVRSNPFSAIIPLALAAIAFAFLVRTETRRPQPLVDFALFANRTFAVAAGLLFLVMSDIMTLLLYYNLFAQSAGGLGLSSIAAGLSLLPLSAALFGFARAAPSIAARFGMRHMLTGASLLLALGCIITFLSLHLEAKFAVLLPGLFVSGIGIALIYASAPRLGLSALPPQQAGKGSGMLNSCSFLGGTVGVTFGGILFALAGFAGVLALLGASALASAALCLRLKAD
ncbi:MFS transporter [Bradyrhizobium lablabi]|uniref:MFS transporter n=1 Tax=Bradyrhizobium lablabi TaxID=722472 RepID=UPI001BACB581|nr:MFS transporter [Bradyrhizobium lablabi]MBR1126032.1 MFS transporter [Bradyrhizobium lablabi]